MQLMTMLQLQTWERRHYSHNDRSRNIQNRPRPRGMPGPTAPPVSFPMPRPQTVPTPPLARADPSQAKAGQAAPSKLQPALESFLNQGAAPQPVQTSAAEPGPPEPESRAVSSEGCSAACYTASAAQPAQVEPASSSFAASGKVSLPEHQAAPKSSDPLEAVPAQVMLTDCAAAVHAAPEPRPVARQRSTQQASHLAAALATAGQSVPSKPEPAATTFPSQQTIQAVPAAKTSAKHPVHYKPGPAASTSPPQQTTEAAPAANISAGQSVPFKPAPAASMVQSQQTTQAVPAAKIAAGHSVPPKPAPARSAIPPRQTTKSDPAAKGSAGRTVPGQPSPSSRRSRSCEAWNPILANVSCGGNTPQLTPPAGPSQETCTPSSSDSPTQLPLLEPTPVTSWVSLSEIIQQVAPKKQPIRKRASKSAPARREFSHPVQASVGRLLSPGCQGPLQSMPPQEIIQHQQRQNWPAQLPTANHAHALAPDPAFSPQPSVPIVNARSWGMLFQGYSAYRHDQMQPSLPTPPPHRMTGQENCSLRQLQPYQCLTSGVADAPAKQPRPPSGDPPRMQGPPKKRPLTISQPESHSATQFSQQPSTSAPAEPASQAGPRELARESIILPDIAFDGQSPPTPAQETFQANIPDPGSHLLQSSASQHMDPGSSSSTAQGIIFWQAGCHALACTCTKSSFNDTE